MAVHIFYCEIKEISPFKTVLGSNLLSIKKLQDCCEIYAGMLNDQMRIKQNTRYPVVSLATPLVSLQEGGYVACNFL